MKLDLTRDSLFNIGYVTLRRKIARVTTIAVSDSLNVDIGQDGRIYGIELLNGNEQLGPKCVNRIVKFGMT